jgi:large subunit ribosomal protein L31
MKADIHPAYGETTVTCTCGSTFTTRSTAKNGVIHADVCSQCHPFYTGKQKILDTGGRVARFEKPLRQDRSTSDSKLVLPRAPAVVGRVSPPSRGRPPTGARFISSGRGVT